MGRWLPSYKHGPGPAPQRRSGDLQQERGALTEGKAVATAVRQTGRSAANCMRTVLSLAPVRVSGQKRNVAENEARTLECGYIGTRLPLHMYNLLSVMQQLGDN